MRGEKRKERHIKCNKLYSNHTQSLIHSLTKPTRRIDNYEQKNRMICVRRPERIKYLKKMRREREKKMKCAPRYAIMSMQKNIVDCM